MTKIEHSGITWIDIDKPTKDKLEAHAKTLFKLHPIVEQELLVPAFRAKADAYDGLIYLVLHFPVFDEKLEIAQPKEVDFVITKQAVLSAHYEEVPEFHEFTKKLQSNESLQKRLMKTSTLRVTYEMILHLLHFAGRQLDNIDRKISIIEKDIFAYKQRDTVRKISLLRSDIINFSRAMRPLEPVFEELAFKGPELFGKRSTIYFNNILSEYRKTMSNIQMRSEIIYSLQTTNDSMVSFHINQFLKILAIINLLVVPISVLQLTIAIRWLWQELVGPLARSDALLTLMIALGADLLLLLYFKRKKWL